MAAAKPKAKKGKKVTKSLKEVNVAVGLKKEPAAKGEVVGHISPGAWYVCFNDGVLNWVPPGWTYFICRGDGVLNRV